MGNESSAKGRAQSGRYKLKNPVRFYGRIGLMMTAVLVLFFSIWGANRSTLGSETDPGAAEESGAIPSAVPPVPSSTLPPTPEGQQWRDFTVVLDAGHGGRDPGALSPKDERIVEENITLGVALACREQLEKAGFRVLMTREDDTALADTVAADLAARAELANRAEATLFISIHVNSIDLKIGGAAAVSGMDCYYAEKDNLFPEFTDERLAILLGEGMTAANGNKLNGIIKKRLAVVRSTKMPATLVEIGYITNTTDQERLTRESYRDDTAEGITEGVMRAAAELPAEKRDGVWKILMNTQPSVETSNTTGTTGASNAVDASLPVGTADTTGTSGTSNATGATETAEVENGG